MSISIESIPNKSGVPERGGVRTHILDLIKCIENDDSMHLTTKREFPDITIVQSSYISHIRTPDIYVCHGGFIPQPMQSVMENIKTARVVVLVADWIKKFVPPQHLNKCIHIPNGVFAEEIRTMASGKPILNPGYILYAKELEYYFDDFVWLAKEYPNKRFVTVYANPARELPHNVERIGFQNHQDMMNIVKYADSLVLTGSEVCPIMLLEAWALGTPVLARDIDGNAEIMCRKGGSIVGGCLYGTKDDMAYQLQELLKHDAEHSGAAIEMAESHYDWSAIWPTYKEIIEDILR